MGTLFRDTFCRPPRKSFLQGPLSECLCAPTNVGARSFPCYCRTTSVWITQGLSRKTPRVAFTQEKSESAGAIFGPRTGTFPVSLDRGQAVSPKEGFKKPPFVWGAIFHTFLGYKRPGCFSPLSRFSRKRVPGGHKHRGWKSTSFGTRGGERFRQLTFFCGAGQNFAGANFFFWRPPIFAGGDM